MLLSNRDTISLKSNQNRRRTLKCNGKHAFTIRRPPVATLPSGPPRPTQSLQLLPLSQTPGKSPKSEIRSTIFGTSCSHRQISTHTHSRKAACNEPSEPVFNVQAAVVACQCHFRVHSDRCRPVLKVLWVRHNWRPRVPKWRLRHAL